jgi:hypothetical protein
MRLVIPCFVPFLVFGTRLVTVQKIAAVTRLVITYHSGVKYRAITSIQQTLESFKSITQPLQDSGTSESSRTT